MELKEILNIKDDTKAMTHAGIFHADDVFSTALLFMINPGIEVSRVNEVPDEFDGIIYDIGMGAYDHHQMNKRERNNGVPFAAFGLLWEKIGPAVYGQEIYELLDKELVEKMDYTDNTGCKNMISETITEFNVAWNGGTEIDERFFAAVDFAKGILERKINKYQSNMAAAEYIQSQMCKAKDGILVLEYGMPWQEVVVGSGIEFVVFPSSREGYVVQTVLRSDDSGEPIVAFPREWYGKSKEELRKISGIDGFIFCHNAGFLACVESMDDAVKMIRISRGVV
ncbi:MAG: MYG1 family protein [Clostridium sp.]|nr:MYG1 family protein [Clostridium sp.]MCM1172867.1 MYG1 family protein [Clostridium sp.]